MSVPAASITTNPPPDEELLKMSTEEMEHKLKTMALEEEYKETQAPPPSPDQQHLYQSNDEELLPEERWDDKWNGQLEKLKTVYVSQGIPDYELRNFLIYVHGDMQKATERIEKCLAWRRQHLPIPRATILKPLQQNIFSFHGFDLAGRPVGYFRLDGHDRKNRDIEQYVKAIVYQSEKLLERMGGNSNYRVTLVIDRRGANLFNQDLDLYKAFFKIFADLYPMKLYRVLLYPATRVTRVLWSLLRPFVHSHVQRRLVLISANSKAEWEGFAPYIARDQLLEDFGGTLEDKEAEGEEKKDK